MKVEKNKSLINYNTFGLPCVAESYTELSTIKSVMDFPWTSDVHMLGGGSNCILPSKLSKVVKVTFKKKKTVVLGTDILLRLGAGLEWKRVVTWCAKNNFHGIENLAAIPGTVGGAVVQNIGAYGIELTSFVEEVLVYNRSSKSIEILTHSQCNFSYRNSLFKTLNNYCVLSITIRLSKLFQPILTFSELSTYFLTIKPSGSLLVDKITRIRSNKLPNWRKTGNCGSFFTNPVISQKQFKQLSAIFTLKPQFLEDGMIKLSAAQLIDLASLKGYSVGGAAVSTKHALVLINCGSATRNNVYELSQYIISTIYKLFSITLIPEVIFYD